MSRAERRHFATFRPHFATLAGSHDPHPERQRTSSPSFAPEPPGITEDGCRKRSSSPVERYGWKRSTAGPAPASARTGAAAGRAEHFHLVLDHCLHGVDDRSDDLHDREFLGVGRELPFERRAIGPPNLRVDVDLRDPALDGAPEFVVGRARPAVQAQIRPDGRPDASEQLQVQTFRYGVETCRLPMATANVSMPVSAMKARAPSGVLNVLRISA
jgi:hypothetical protein